MARDKPRRRRLSPWIVAVGLFASLNYFGCAEPLPPKNPQEALQRGQPMAALRLAYYGKPEEKAAVVRRILQTYDPEVAVEPVSDDELLKGLDGPTVRQLSRLAIVVRVTTKKKPPKEGGYSALPFHTAVAIEGPEAALWRHGRGGQALSAFTGEDYPLGRSETTWQSRRAFEIRSVGDAIIGIILFPGLIIDALPTSTTTAYPPTKDEILATAPRAAQAEERLADVNTDDRSVSYVIFRKPVDPQQPFDLQIAVSVGEGTALGRASIRIPLPPAPTLEERIRLAGHTRRILEDRDVVFDSDGSHAGNYWCQPDSMIAESGLEDYLGKCKSVPLVTPGSTLMPWIGLQLPTRPQTLGTYATSEAKRPSWAPTTPRLAWRTLEALPKAKADADARFLACRLMVPHDKHGSAAKSTTLQNQAVGDRVLNGLSSQPEEVFFSQILWPANGSMTFTFKNDKSPKFSELVVRRNGTEIQTQFVPATADAATCFALDREGIETAFSSAWALATDSIDVAEKTPVRIRPGEPDLGYSSSKLAPLAARVAECATWVGWDDPRVIELVDRRDRQEKRFGEVLVQAVKGLAAKKGPPNPQSKLRIGEASVGCRGAGKRCRIVNPTENTGDEPLLPYHSPVVVFADGRYVRITRSFDRIAPKTTQNVEMDFERPDAGAVPLGIFMEDADRIEARLFSVDSNL